MPAELPEPGPLGLSAGAVVAVPETGLRVYRLVREPISDDDFRPMSHQRAAATRAPELLRTGLSHYLTAEAVRGVAKDPASRVAAIDLTPRRDVHIARTGRHPEHVTVWAPRGVLKEAASLVD